MEQFLVGLDGLDWLFLSSAILGTTIFVGKTILSFMGLSHHHGGGDHAGLDVHHGADHHDGHAHDSDLDFKAMSLQGLTAFAMMFGIIGLGVSTEMHMPAIIALFAGGTAGAVMIWVAKKMFRFAGQMQSKGNVSLDNAIGVEGTVYLTIQPGGIGKAQLLVQNRLKVLDARTEEPGEVIKTGDRVRVMRIADNILIVEKIPELPESVSLENIS